MKILAQYDAYGNVLQGVWWINPDTGLVQSEYLNPDSPEAARGTVIVRGKIAAASWSGWFDELTTRAPYSEDWVVYDSMGMSPHDFLTALVPSSLR